jgi:two-component system, NtrC family, response regulator GlrR
MTRQSPLAMPHLVGNSPVHTQLMDKLQKIAPTDVEILISGPTGTGKELYAQYIHCQSARAQASFVPVNCGGLPSDLIENELFGHVGGAFTGARPQSDGLVAAAEGGTLFLDEVDSMPLPSQANLLRFLQDKQYRRLGETRLRRANVRIVAATNCDLIAAVGAKTFREDLFFRLRVAPVDVPSLAERPDDLRLLADTFADRCSETYKLPRIVIGPRALDRMSAYSWPGNIRELENCVKYLTCLQLTRPIDIYDLPLLNEGDTSDSLPIDALAEAGPLKALKRGLVCEFERAYLKSALRLSGGNIAAAARASGKPRRAFFELMRKRGLTGGKSEAASTEEGEEDSTLVEEEMADGSARANGG